MIGIVYRLGSFSRFAGSGNIVGGVERGSSSVSSRIGSDKSWLRTGSLGEGSSLGIDRCSGRVTFRDFGDDLGSWLPIDRGTLNNRLVLRVLSTSIGDVGKVAYDWVVPASNCRYIGKSCSVVSMRSVECPLCGLGDNRNSTWGLSIGLRSICIFR